MKTLRHIGQSFYKAWMKFAAALAFINTTIILIILYIVIIVITSIVMRLLGKDLLDKRIHATDTLWQEKNLSFIHLNTVAANFKNL